MSPYSYPFTGKILDDEGNLLCANVSGEIHVSPPIESTPDSPAGKLGEWKGSALVTAECLNFSRMTLAVDNQSSTIQPTQFTNDSGRLYKMQFSGVGKPLPDAFTERLLSQVPENPAYPQLRHHDDSVEFLLKQESHYAEWKTVPVLFYRSQETNEIVGGLVRLPDETKDPEKYQRELIASLDLTGNLTAAGLVAALETPTKETA